MIRPFNDVDLHAFVDKQVGPDRRVAIASYLSSAPDDAARVAAWSSQNEAARALFASGATDPVPLWLTVGQILSTKTTAGPTKRQQQLAVPASPRRGVRTRLQPRQRQSVVAVLAFGAGLVVALGAERLPVWGEWRVTAAEPTASRSFEARALEAHRFFGLDPDHPAEVPAGQTRSFLAERVPFPVRIPDLGAGWTLLGGRVVPTEHGAGALLVYGDSAGGRVSLVTGRPSPGGADPEGWLAGESGVVTGTDRGVRYAWMTSKDEAWLKRNAVDLHRVMQDASAE